MAQPLDQFPNNLPSAPAPLPNAIDGSKFVANPVGGNPGQGQSPINMANQMWQQAGGSMYQPANVPSAVDVTQQTMAGILNPGNAYIDSARRAGLEHVSARGGLNSSIGAGASQRAAIDAALPLYQQTMGLTSQRESQDFQGTQADQQRAVQRASEAMNLTKQREGLAFQGQQSGLDRIQNVNNQLLQQQLRERQSTMDHALAKDLRQDQTAQQDWLASQDYTRRFNGNLAMLPIQNAVDAQNALLRYALEEPEVYTPAVISGMTNFLTGNLASLFAQWFPNAKPAGGN